jgi:hypothetical protein
LAAVRSQGLIEAPVAEVWGVLEDPSRFQDWAQDAISVTGAPTRVEKGSTFQVEGRGPFGLPAKTIFKVEELSELREIKLRCQTSGYYSHWLLTEARGDTFAEVEVGVEPIGGMQGRVLSALHTRRYLRRIAEGSLDSIRRFCGRAQGSSQADAGK